MDRKTLLAISLCFLIYLGWQKFYIEPRFPVGKTGAPTAQTTPISSAPVKDSATTSQAAPTATTPTKTREPQKMTLATSTGDAIISDTGPIFTDWTLKSYKLGLAPQAASVDLQSVTHQKGTLTLAFDSQSLGYLNQVQGQFTQTAQGLVWSYEDQNVKLTREIVSSNQKPYVDLKFTAHFKTQAPKYGFISILSQSVQDDPEAQDRQLVYWSNQSLERISIKDEIPQKQIQGAVKYIGTTNRYFLMSVVDQNPAGSQGALIQQVDRGTGRISLVYPVSGNDVTFPVRVYFGPKELDVLRQVEPTLDHTIDFGWFTVFAYPLLKVLKWLYQYVQNYGVAIILLTLLLKILTYPLTYKSMKSMKNMAKLQPQLQKLRDKYKDDKEALNREMLTLMRGNGYNPAAGCLPMIIQMPIFFALYRVLYSSIELYHAPFAMWIHDLSYKDPFYVTPILLSVTMFVQQKLTPNTATDPAQAKMMQLMPLIFGAFMLTLPSGLTIYMLVNALASIVQQMILNKKLDVKPAR
jgi:YidC/Oxa1 family membrane protein insertase